MPSSSGSGTGDALGARFSAFSILIGLQGNTGDIKPPAVDKKRPRGRRVGSAKRFLHPRGCGFSLAGGLVHTAFGTAQSANVSLDVVGVDQAVFRTNLVDINGDIAEGAIEA